ncbi:hypothetical protein SAMN05216226_103114 [Halovenus aranensis]|jgi:hypothetical protein|uniref:Uncharacterized protein n=1 Tax=Halovenus aranensis TaxID=890420 RepID=A0A1G8TK65_9EURY|nr:hypothetical protein [Halovenus aranensis]SDJ41908.1 hypothetical protein SAMN05216226_103114 [Halovenus aranensis]
MPERRQFLCGVATAATVGLAGCSGGGGDGGDDGEDSGNGAVPANIAFDGDAGEHLELTPTARFENKEFGDTMIVEGTAQNTADNLRLHVELVVEMERYLKTGTASKSIEPGGSWEFTIELSDVDPDRIDEYTLRATYTDPPEEV